MGKFSYGSNGREIEIDDRLLTHLKIVMLSKLRRQESFAFSWVSDSEHGSGRVTVWLSPGVELEFAFDDAPSPAINRAWVQALNSTAEHGELAMVPEPPDPNKAAPSTRSRL